MKNCIDDSERECPVCGKTSERPILELLNGRLGDLASAEASLAKEYAEYRNNASLDEIQTAIQHLCEVSNNSSLMSEDVLLAFCLTGGDAKNVANVEEVAAKLVDLNNQLQLAQAARTKFYERLKENRDEIVSIIKMKFDVTDQDIIFDDDHYKLQVQLHRNAEEYSTGEITLMLLMVHLNEFRAGDANLLILDDPITSFDISNQYVILFDLIKLAEEKDKTVIVLTHNINCINIADSQYKDLFDYRFIDRSSSGVRILPIQLKGQEPSVQRYICDDTLCVDVQQRANNPFVTYERYLDAVQKRESEDERLHNVFHYNGPSGNVLFEDVQLCNDFLVSLIDDFVIDKLLEGSFSEQCVAKAVHLIALRVWVEKQIFDLHSKDEAYQDAETVTLVNKIDYAFPRGQDALWRGASKVSRSYLMGKKVMLNQASHVDAQSIPFDYALNLSLLDIEKTIEDMKATFMETRG